MRKIILLLVMGLLLACTESTTPTVGGSESPNFVDGSIKGLGNKSAMAYIYKKEVLLGKSLTSETRYEFTLEDSSEISNDNQFHFSVEENGLYALNILSEDSSLNHWSDSLAYVADEGLYLESLKLVQTSTIVVLLQNVEGSSYNIYDLGDIKAKIKNMPHSIPVIEGEAVIGNLVEGSYDVEITIAEGDREITLMTRRFFLKEGETEFVTLYIK